MGVVFEIREWDWICTECCCL